MASNNSSDASILDAECLEKLSESTKVGVSREVFQNSPSFLALVDLCSERADQYLRLDASSKGEQPRRFSQRTREAISHNVHIKPAEQNGESKYYEDGTSEQTAICGIEIADVACVLHTPCFMSVFFWPQECCNCFICSAFCATCVPVGRLRWISCWAQTFTSVPANCLAQGVIVASALASCIMYLLHPAVAFPAQGSVVWPPSSQPSSWT